ncbi:probable methyltransferase-like protein 24 [Palaemon carinicauda]|uniref:probable methyltransferase-like protein 24 n=1 Tax=Palaemon carinicauda TaxID=392227 RepID=UPI0035B602F0
MIFRLLVPFGKFLRRKSSLLFLFLIVNCILLRDANQATNHSSAGDDPEVPSGEYLLKEEFVSAVARLHRHLSTVRSHCQRMTRMGGLVTCSDCQKCIIDGGKLLCLDQDVRPVPGSCHALSFGIGYDLSFERALVQYGCQVTAFDPTSVNLTDMVHPGNIQAIRVGLDERDHEFVQNFTDLQHKKTEQHKMSYKRYQSIIDLLDYPDIQLLKIDIEGSEWKVFSDILSSVEGRNLLENIRQILLEVHLDFLTSGDDIELIYSYVMQATEVFETLEKLGFYLAAFELNESTLSQYVFNNVTVDLYKEISLIKRIPKK